MDRSRVIRLLSAQTACQHIIKARSQQNSAKFHAKSFSVVARTDKEDPPPPEEVVASEVSPTFLSNYDRSTTAGSNNISNTYLASARSNSRNESSSISRHCTGTMPNPKSVKNNLEFTIFNKCSSIRGESKFVINYLGNGPTFFLAKYTNERILRLGKLRKGFRCHAFLCSNSMKTLHRRVSERTEKCKQAIFMPSSDTMPGAKNKFVSNFMKIHKHNLSSQGLVIQKRLCLAQVF